MASDNGQGNDTLIAKNTAVEQLVSLLLPKERQGASRRIGNELEVFVVDADTAAPIDFPTHQRILTALVDRLAACGLSFELGHEKHPRTDEDILTHLNGTERQKGWTVCGEPGCQFEWAPGPETSLCDVAEATDKFLTALAEAAANENGSIAISGLYPLQRGIDIPLSGRPRYHALQPRISSVADNYGHDLSRGTCGVQVNLDTTPENWVASVQTSLGIQPILVALFANSAVFNGQVTPEIVSNRAILWFELWGARLKQFRDTVLRADFSVADFVDYALDQEIPILVRKDGDVPLPLCTTLGDLIDPARRPDCVTGDVTAGDCINAFGTFYGEIKIKPKGLIEWRGPDGSYELRHALAALAVGLLYDEESLGKAHRLVMSWSEKERDDLAYQAPRAGLDASFGTGTIRDVALQLCTFAHDGLVSRGLHEEVFLAPLLEIARGHEPTLAAATLAAIHAGESVKDVLARSVIPSVATHKANVKKGMVFNAPTLIPAATLA